MEFLLFGKGYSVGIPNMRAEKWSFELVNIYSMNILLRLLKLPLLSAQNTTSILNEIPNMRAEKWYFELVNISSTNILLLPHFTTHFTTSLLKIPLLMSTLSTQNHVQSKNYVCSCLLLK